MNQDPSKPFTLSHRGKELALAHFNHVEQQVTLATTTAGLIVAADALIIGAYLVLIKDFQIFTKLSASPRIIAFSIGGGLFLLGFVFALAAAFPNIAVGWFHLSVDNLFFFGTIATQTFGVYSSCFFAHDQGQTLDKELLSQIWAKSRWLVRMFRLIQVAVGCTVAGVLLTVVIVISVLLSI